MLCIVRPNGGATKAAAWDQSVQTPDLAEGVTGELGMGFLEGSNTRLRASDLLLSSHSKGPQVTSVNPISENRL
jgi:hypothetical protein